MNTPRKRRVLVAGATVAGVAAVTAPVAMALAEDAGSSAKDEAACEIAPLSGPEGNASGSVTAVSADGEYMAGTADDQTVVWHDEDIMELGEDTWLVDINSEGVAVGYGDYGDGRTGPWMWADGEFTGLEVPDVAGDRVEPSGINDSGDIVGSSGTNLDDEFIPVVPLKWEAGSTQATVLKVQEEKGEATDISNDGQIVGSQHTGEDGPIRPWLWDGDGAGEELPHTPGDEGDSAEPVHISGDFALSSIGGPDSAHYVWDLSKPQVRQEPLEMYSPAGVDEQGRAYGEDFEESEITYAAFESEEGLKNLPLLKPEDELGEGDHNVVHAASDDGTVLAGSAASQDSASGRAVVWTGCS